jgi:hypothetical protein
LADLDVDLPNIAGHRRFDFAHQLLLSFLWC